MDRRFLNEDECDEGERHIDSSVEKLTSKNPWHRMSLMATNGCSLLLPDYRLELHRHSEFVVVGLDLDLLNEALCGILLIESLVGDWWELEEVANQPGAAAAEEFISTLRISLMEARADVGVLTLSSLCSPLSLM